MNNVYTPPNLAKGGAQNFFYSLFVCGAPLFDTPISKILHKTLRTILRVTDALNVLDCSSTTVRQN